MSELGGEGVEEKKNTKRHFRLDYVPTMRQGVQSSNSALSCLRACLKVGAEADGVDGVGVGVEVEGDGRSGVGILMRWCG